MWNIKQLTILCDELVALNECSLVSLFINIRNHLIQVRFV